MVQVNQFFKQPNYFPDRIPSKTGRKVVQKNCEVMSTFHITLRLQLPNFDSLSLHAMSKKYLTYYSLSDN